MTQTRNRVILRTSAAALLQRVAQLLSSLVTLPLALHALGVAGFGIWGAATSLLWLSSMLGFGLGSALITLLPTRLLAGETDAARAYVTAALYGGAVLAAALLAGGAALLLTGVPAPSAPFLVAELALLCNIPLSIGAEIWFALQKGYVAALWNLLQTALMLGGLVVGVALGAGVTWLVAVFYGALLLANGGCLLHALLAHHTVRPLRRLPVAALRAVLTQGGMLSAIAVAASCSSLFDNVMALAWLGPDASARMAVAMRVCITASGFIGAVTQPFWPSFADALAAHDHAWIRRAQLRGMAAVLALSLGGGTILVAVGGPALHFWLHQDLGLTPGLLWAMAAWIAAMTFTNLPAALLNASQTLIPQTLVLGVAALAGFALKYWAARHYGVVGILLVSPVLWFALVGPVYIWLVARVISTR